MVMTTLRPAPLSKRSQVLFSLPALPALPVIQETWAWVAASSTPESRNAATVRPQAQESR
jgi:hypothetical protein